jgi:hypothetical protein
MDSKGFIMIGTLTVGVLLSMAILEEPVPLNLGGSPKLEVVSCPGDGSCLFWAIGYHVMENAHTVRGKIVNELDLNRSKYESFVTGSYNKYVREMSMPGTWGDEPELAAAAHVYRRRVEVYDMNKKIISTYGTSFIGNPIRVRYNGSSHYDTLKY